MIINNFKVYAATTDITSLIQGMTFFESINGLLKGNLQILDGINFFDRVIGGNNELVPVEVSFTVFDETCTNIFMMDGINQMKIFKSEKQYVLHLITPEEFHLKTNDVNKVFSGSSHHIAGKIYESVTDVSSLLQINSIASTNGKYIVPNIPALNAINNIVNTAVCPHHTGFYFYQRLWDQGTCRLAALYDMDKDFHVNPNGDRFSIKDINISLQDLGAGEVVQQGAASNFELQEYKIHQADKLASGEYGFKLHEVQLDETKIKKNEALPNNSSAVSVRHKLSSKLYDVLTESRGPHGEPVQYQEKSLFSDVNSPNNQAAYNQKRRIYNNTILVNGMTPSPYLGAGKATLLELGESEVSYSISDGSYVIADINHMFTVGDGNVNYEQNVKLLREYA